MRRVLQADGWVARSWQQDGLLVEEEGRRQLRSGGGSEAILPHGGASPHTL